VAIREKGVVAEGKSGRQRLWAFVGEKS